MTAVSGAVRRHNQGDEPNAAIAKAAAAEGLNAEFTRRAVHMFNTAKTIKHIEDNRRDGEKRGSSFPLADVDEVLRRMVGGLADEPAGHKKAAGAASESSMRDFASVPPERLPAMTKVAAEPYLGDIEEKYSKVSRLLNAQRIKVAETRLKAAAMTERQQRQFDDLVELFRGPDSVRFDLFREKTAAARGAAIMPVLDALEGKVRAFGKSGSFTAFGEAADRLDAALRMAAETWRAKQAWEAESARLDEMEAAVKQARGKGPEGDRPDFFKRAAPEGAKAPAKGGLGSFLDDYLNPLTPKQVEPEDTGFAARVKSIDAQAQLAKLMATDDVIGRGNYPRDDVIAAYNELTKLSPSIANQPIILRAELRRYLESAGSRGTGMSTFDAGQVVEALNEADRGVGSLAPKRFSDAAVAGGQA
jgi:hypothetical protein